MAMTRVNDANSRLDQEDPQMVALRNVVRHVYNSHGFDNILLVARNCPVGSAAKKTGLNTSIERQLQFLRNVVPKDLMESHPEKIIQWKAVGLSCYSESFVDKLSEQLAIHGEKTLVLCVRPDHMARHPTQYSRLRKCFSKGGHGAMSFHWDHETNIDVSEALQLDQAQNMDPSVAAWKTALESQRRAPEVRMSWPMTQPILWILGDTVKYVPLPLSHTCDCASC
jgi:hypothetical protein